MSLKFIFTCSANSSSPIFISSAEVSHMSHSEVWVVGVGDGADVGASVGAAWVGGSDG
jgi:hypothetical protein